MIRLRGLSLILAILLGIHVFALASIPVNASEALSKPITIRTIYVDNQNVFNPEIEKESGFAYRLTNALHIRTRERVVKEYLLFKTGDTLSVQLIEESERILRAKRNLQDAEITYQVDGLNADIYVKTLDTWSLKPKVSYKHKGNVSKTEFGIQEDNLLGLGIRASLSYRNDGERESKVLKLRDDNVFGNWHTAAITYIDSTDGNEQYAGFFKPFYALNVKRSYGIEYGHTDKETTLYEQGDELYRYRSNSQFSNLFWGYSSGLKNNNVLRHTFGLFSETKDYEAISAYINLEYNVLQHQFLPNNYQSTYPYYAIDYLQNSYRKTINFERIGRTEDIYMGFKAGFKIGYGDERWGNDESRWYTHAYAQKTYALGENQLLFLSANMDGRLSDKGSQNLLATAGFKYYHAQTNYFKGYLDMYSHTAINTDENDTLYLDADSGLRGYPLHYISGQHLQKITLEQRYYSDSYLWRIFHVGATAFFDAGRITGASDPTQDGIYKDFGLGLRLSNNRSSKGDVIHIDLAYPMDAQEADKGWTLSIESKATF